MSISLFVDFGNRDIDDAIRLTTKGTVESINEQDVQLCDGLELTITDGELYAVAVVSMRDGMWVARIVRWLSTDKSDKGNGD
jgi:hypothetical protein